MKQVSFFASFSESLSEAGCWDGTYRAKVLSPDAYVYYIKALDQNQLIKKGNVTLVK